MSRTFRLCSRRALIGAGALAFAWAGPTRAEDPEVIPAGFPLSRYEKTLARSPFALPTSNAPSVAQTQKQPGWSDDLFIAGVMTIGEKNVVTVSQRGDAQRFLLASGEESPQGVSVINVQWSEQLGQTRVTVKKGAEFAVLLFDQASLASTRSAAPAPRVNSPTPPPASFAPPGGNPVRPLPQRPPAGGPTLPNPGGQAVPVVPVTGAVVNPAGADFPRPRPRQIIRAEPNAPATPPPRAPALSGGALPD